MIVYWDMDGVLADLEGAISSYTDTPRGALLANAEQSHEVYLARREDLGLYESFRCLEPLNLESIRDIMRRIHKRGHVNQILTAYGVQTPLEMGDEVHRGKADFLREHYGDLFEDGTIFRFNGVAKGHQKSFYATAESILIDDWGRNVEGFRKAGGFAVHYDSNNHDACMIELLDRLGMNHWG